MPINNSINFDSFKHYIHDTTDKTISFEGGKLSQKKHTLLDRIKYFFGISQDPYKQETIHQVKCLLGERIKERLPGAKKNAADIENILSRIFRACHVKESQLDHIDQIKRAINFVESFEGLSSAPPFDDEHPEMIEGQTAKNLLKFLLADQSPLTSKLLNLELIKGLLFIKNESLLKEIEAELQAYLEKLAIKLNDKAFSSPHEQKIGEALIANILALYPFFEPKDGAIVKIPQKIDGQWIAVPCKLDLLQMTPSWKGDPYYACGFIPVDNDKASPQLVFMGTPPPTTKGVAHAEFTDVIPGLSVGHTVYNEGKEVIEAWVRHAYAVTKRKVNVQGMSLGGALTFRLALEMPEYMGKAFLFNAPTLWKSEFEQYQKKFASLKEDQKPEMNVFVQEKDLVSFLGAGWDPSWNVYLVISEKEVSFYEAHVQVFPSQHNVIVLKLTRRDIEATNVSRARRVFNIAAEILRVPFLVVKGTALGIQIGVHQFKVLKQNASRLIHTIHNLALFSFFKSLPKPLMVQP